MMFKCGKKHCLWLHGDAGSGKSFVMSSLTTLLLNVGTVGSLVPKNDFCYSEIPHKRVVLMDEATIPKDCHNDFKNFFAGQPVLCNIKHKKPEMSSKAFWILLTNNDDVVDINDPIWSSRICKSKRLITLDRGFHDLHSTDEKHINPMAWLHLFKNHQCA